MTNETPDFEYLSGLIKGEFREKFSAYYALLKEFNKKFNLTAVIEEEDVFYKHFLDSSAAELWIKEGSSVAEVGSGAGFPSFPLKFLRDDLKFTLIESVGKKCDFLNTVVQKMNLSGMTVVKARCEELAHDSAYREKFDVCTARAVASLNTLCEYCLPFVRVGGTFIAYKGDAEEELKNAGRAISVLGGHMKKRICYSLPKEMGARNLVFIGKEKSTPTRYPRGHGKERSAPL